MHATCQRERKGRHECCVSCEVDWEEFVSDLIARGARKQVESRSPALPSATALCKDIGCESGAC